MNRSQPKIPGRRLPAIQIERAPIRSLNEILVEHGMEPGDEFVGPEGARYFLDYDGDIEVLADSRRRQDRSEHEKALRDRLRALIETK